VPIALTLVIFAARTRAVPLSGDEPHYLIMADSIASDFDLDLHNNYLSDFDSRRIVGLTIPHVFNVQRGWMPAHEPGLSMLIALPFRLGGIAGAHVALCLLAGLLPWSLFTWFRTKMPPSTAAWLTLGLTICLPVCFGAQQIYGDLTGGVIATALFLHVIAALDGVERPLWTWALFWLAAGLFPWLHAKFVLTAVLLIAAGITGMWRQLRGAPELPDVPNAHLRATVPLFIVGPALQMAFNTWASGSPLGFRHASELTTSFGRGAGILLGLHLDQSQGMFLQQPLLVCGVLAFPAFAARRRGLALLWTIIYLSLIVPNALELTRYGGDGPDGRFAWSAAWLWTIPIGFVVGERHARLTPWVQRAAISGWIYQAALAARWLKTPDVLFPALDERLWARDSLFPIAMRRWLPSYYFWDFSSYWTYGPNIAAAAVVTALLIAGARASGNRDYGESGNGDYREKGITKRNGDTEKVFL
jgi:hypothetical protein